MQWQLRVMDVMIRVMDAEKDKKVMLRYESMTQVTTSLVLPRHTLRCVFLVLLVGRGFRRRQR